MTPSRQSQRAGEGRNPSAFEPIEHDVIGPAKASPPPFVPPEDLYDLEDSFEKPALGDSEVDDFVRPGRSRATPMWSKSRHSRGNKSPGVPTYVAVGIAGFLVLLLLASFLSHSVAMVFSILVLLAGIVVYLGGGLWMLITPFRESAVCGLLYLFLPFYPLYYLVSRWEDMKRPFLCAIGGFGILLTGVLALVGFNGFHGRGGDGNGLDGRPPASDPLADGSRGDLPAPAFPPPVPVPAPSPFPTPGSSPAPKANQPRFTPGSGSFAGGTSTTPAPTPTPLPPPDRSGPRFTPGGGFASTTPALWNVRIDPPARPVAFDEVQDLIIPIQASHDAENVLFPTAPSDYVLVGRNRAPNEVRELWSISRKKRVARLAGKVDIEGPLALSADGTYLAGRVPFKNAVLVLDLPAGKVLGQLDFPQHKPDYLDFAGSNRLVLGFSWEKSIQIWDLTAQRQLATFAVPRLEKDATCVSPGGRYVATIAEHALRIHATEDGQELAMEPLPKGENNWELNGKGLAFSPDGSELAALCEAFGKLYVIVWQADSGKLLARHGPYDRDTVPQPPGYTAQPIQWLPRQDGWLVHGESIIEKVSGKKAWNLPFDNDNFKVGARKVLNDQRALIVYGRDGRRLVAAPLETEKMAAAMRIAREGGNPIDASLPTLKRSDLGGARRATLSEGSISWGVTPDPKPAARKLSGRPLTLQTRPPEISRILFAAPETAQVAVSSQPDKLFPNQPPKEDGKPLIIDRFDLASGKHLGRQELPPLIDLRAFSPDGSVVLTGNYKDRDRLDAFGTEGQPVASWRPHDNESGDAQKVVWADFLSPSKVLTVNQAGTLVLWSLPDCQADYVIEQACQGLPVFSPGRKYLALFHDGGFDLIDPATAEVKGRTAATAGPSTGLEVVAAAFPPSGQELSAVIGSKLVRWDMTSGKILAEFPIGGEARTLDYCGANHLLLNGQTLYDRNRRRAVWSYLGAVHASGSPDPLHWLVLGNPFRPGQLGSLALPEPKVEAMVAQSENKAVPAILRAGTRAQVQLEVGNPPRDGDAFRRKLNELLTSKLRAVGATAAQDASVRLVARITEQATGETMELEKLVTSFRDRGDRRLSIAIRNLECELSIADPQGPISLAKTSIPMRQFFGILHLPPGEQDVEGYLLNQTWMAAQNWFASVGLPSYVARGGEGVVMLPGTTDLSQLVR
jgi:WD40 repeat protein